MLIDPITQGDNVRIQFAKDVSIRAFTFPKKDLDGIKELIGCLNHELIPYNNFASIKYKELHMEFPLK